MSRDSAVIGVFWIVGAIWTGLATFGIWPRRVTVDDADGRWEPCADCGCISLQLEPGFDCAFCGHTVSALSVQRSSSGGE